MFDSIYGAAVVLPLVFGVITTLSHPRFSSAISAASGVMLVAAVAVPLLSLFSEIVRLPSFSPLLPTLSGVSDYTEEKYLDALVDYIADEMGVPREDVSVACEGFELSTLRFRSITVTLSGSAVFSDTTRLREVLSSNFVADGGTARVLLDFG